MKKIKKGGELPKSVQDPSNVIDVYNYFPKGFFQYYEMEDASQFDDGFYLVVHEVFAAIEDEISTAAIQECVEAIKNGIPLSDLYKGIILKECIALPSSKVGLAVCFSDLIARMMVNNRIHSIKICERAIIDGIDISKLIIVNSLNSK